ncbi:3-deoxy-D-manno-octulosonic acid transferase [Rurimicrobium arvi]|uniref:3-deoxy-D-manno-octulosonic acid transferase n=1 Tax=Rurimicrobium arvi TaxID=2049916 RepID=A0ABP8MRX7_9BACT
MLYCYRFLITMYEWMLRCAAPFKPKAKLFLEGRKGLLLRIKAVMAGESRPRIWVHCASLGEFEQGRNLIELLRSEYPGYALVLTFFSPSGYQVRKKYKGADYVFYLPLDKREHAEQFVLDVQPSLAVFVKYDLWYYYLSTLQRRQIPAILISAIFREHQNFFKFYGGLRRDMLRMFTHIFVQDELSQQLLQGIGINQVTVAGDTRFDRVLFVKHKMSSLPEVERLCQNHKLLIAGSTWAPDEALLAEVLPVLPDNWKLVIVPHEVDQQRIEKVAKTFNGKIKRWSEWEDGAAFTERVLVVDTIGILLKLYRYASIAWIGGGLSATGVHNVLEPAVYGIPCAFGPQYTDYLEAQELIQSGGATACSNKKELMLFLSSMLENPAQYQFKASAAGNYVASRAGATRRILDYLAEKNWLKTL